MDTKLPFRHSLVRVEIGVDASHTACNHGCIYVYILYCIGRQPSASTPIVGPCKAPSIIGTSEMPCKLCVNVQDNAVTCMYISAYHNVIHSGGVSDTMETANTEQQEASQVEPQNSQQSKPTPSVFKREVCVTIVGVHFHHAISGFGKHPITTKDEETRKAKGCCFNGDRSPQEEE